MEEKEKKKLLTNKKYKKMAEVNLNALTEEQRRALKEELLQEEKARQQKILEDRQTYKKLANETVLKAVPELKELSNKLKETKQKVYNDFQKVLELKKDVFGIDGEQATHTFTSEDGKNRITIGYRMNDKYDDTADVGIAMVKEYLSSLVKDSETENLINIINQLMSKDNKGNLKASRVLQLTKYANESESEKFKEGVKIIQDAYKPEKTKTFVSCQVKNDKDEWEYVPLGITEA